MSKETRVFTITAERVLLDRIERFLALLHFNSGFGHSGLFAMALDGDGNEKVKVEGLPRSLGYEVEAIAGVGYDVEIAHNESYGGKFIDRQRKCGWITGRAANLYKDGEIVRTFPSRDWAYVRSEMGPSAENRNVAGEALQGTGTNMGNIALMGNARAETPAGGERNNT